MGLDKIVKELAVGSGRPVAAPSTQPLLPHLVMPHGEEVRPENVVERRLHGALAAAVECGPVNFANLLFTPGVGARTVFSLALVAEILDGTPCRFIDPARHSLVHGGKDRNPIPVPTKACDRTIAVMKKAVRKAKLSNAKGLAALRRMDETARDGFQPIRRAVHA